MLSRTFFAAILALLLISAASANSTAQDRNLSSKCVSQESTKDITQGGKSTRTFYKEDYDKDENIVKRITGEMSDSRKMGIGVLLVLIGSVLYAGFNWNDDAAF